MATQSNPYLRISDGTTTVSIADGAGGATSYPLAGRRAWTPNVGVLRRDELASRAPYGLAEEQLALNITGATAAAAMANLGTLARLLDQAERWRRGQNVAAVLLQYVPQGSTIHTTSVPLQCPIWGRAEGDETNVGLSPEFNDVGLHFWIQDVQTRLRRGGQWLGASETPASSSAAGSGARHHIAFATSHPEMSPLKVVIDNLTPGAALSLKDSFVFVARNKAGTSDVAGSYIQSHAASTMTATGWTAVADAAQNPIGGTNILRYTPTGTTFIPSGALTLTTPLTVSKRIYVYATLRNNNATRTFQVYVEFTSLGGTRTLTTQTVFIDASTQQPRAVCLGSISIPVDETALPNASYPTVKIYAAVSSTTGSPTLDIDNLIFLGADDEGANVMTVRAFTLPNQSNIDLTFDPQALVSPLPTATLDYTSVTDKLSHEGNLWSNTILDRVTCLWLATQGANWRFANNANVLQTFTFTATRRLAYLTPQ